MVQVAFVGGEALAGMVPPTNRIAVCPAERGRPELFSSEPPQLLIGAGEAATDNPAGRVSVKLTSVYADPVGFRNVIVRVLVPFA